MKIAMGCDHAGLHLKDQVKAHLTELGYEITDCGTYDTASCHYPLFAKKVTTEVIGGRADRGILICGTGVGMSIAANKVKGIRAAVVSDCFTAKAVRMHNDANILCMGERVTGPGLACLIAQLFAETEFEGGRHQIRLDMITDIENEQNR
ncbi:ribose 5-phosphate isomerase B [Acidaminobacterium chupaoyuni]